MFWDLTSAHGVCICVCVCVFSKYIYTHRTVLPRGDDNRIPWTVEFRSDATFHERLVLIDDAILLYIRRLRNRQHRKHRATYTFAARRVYNICMCNDLRQRSYYDVVVIAETLLSIWSYRFLPGLGVCCVSSSRTILIFKCVQIESFENQFFYIFFVISYIKDEQIHMSVLWYRVWETLGRVSVWRTRAITW